MIIWLASYPKSGNTYLRSFLSTYFFSKDGNYSFDLLKNIIAGLVNKEIQNRFNP